MSRRRRIVVVVGILALLLVGFMLLACTLGAVSIPPLDIVKMALNRLPFDDIQQTWQPTDETIIFQIRLLRVLGGALVGAALATAGVLFQGLLRNPMADPYIIGTSAGAALGATLAMLLPVGLAFAGFGLVPIFAFCGALITVMLVYNLARVGGRTPIVSMLLAGFVVNAMLVAVMSLMIIISETLSLKLHYIFSFLMGSISVQGWSQLATIAPLIVGGIIVAQLFAFHLNAFSLGEEGAAYLCINVEREKLFILALGSLLAGHGPGPPAAPSGVGTGRRGLCRGRGHPCPDRGCPHGDPRGHLHRPDRGALLHLPAPAQQEGICILRGAACS